MINSIAKERAKKEMPQGYEKWNWIQRLCYDVYGDDLFPFNNEKGEREIVFPKGLNEESILCVLNYALSETEIKAMLLKYRDYSSFKAIGLEIGHSAEQVRRVLRNARNRLRRPIISRCIFSDDIENVAQKIEKEQRKAKSIEKAVNDTKNAFKAKKWNELTLYDLPLDLLDIFRIGYRGIYEDGIYNIGALVDKCQEDKDYSGGLARILCERGLLVQKEGKYEANKEKNALSLIKISPYLELSCHSSYKIDWFTYLETVEELVSVSREELLDVRGIGQKTVEDIEHCLAAKGLSLRKE